MIERTIDYYNKNSHQIISRYELAKVNELHELLLNTFKKNDKLLEIGCGSGRDAFFMLKNGFDVKAIDGSLNMINGAKKVHLELVNNLFHKVLPEDLIFENKFDGIYSIATLMHLKKDDIYKTILKVYELLNIGGKFLMSVSLFRNDIDELGLDKEGRFFLVLKREEWLNICNNVGFSVIENKISKDGLNRDGIEWLTLILKK